MLGTKNLTTRRKIAGLVFAIYLPTLFILTHIPIPKIVYKAQVSDKILHFLSFFVLFFTLWNCISDEKINFKKKKTWLTLVAIMIYTTLDEYLQTFVGRSADIFDWIADISGVLAAMLLLSFAGFWTSLLITVATIILMMTNLAKTNLDALIPTANMLFHITSHAIFASVWIHWLNLKFKLQSPTLKWLISAAALPAAFLALLKIISKITQKPFTNTDLICAASAVTAVIAIRLIVGLITQKTQRPAKGL